METNIDSAYRRCIQIQGRYFLTQYGDVTQAWVTAIITSS